ncbi:hypothetical protein N9Y68_05370 [Luminiphilus sp.]|nr:hypothetical protein [Luminiphilus sp.]
MDEVVFIGGSKAWGSGKVISSIRAFLTERDEKHEFIETQGARWSMLLKLISIGFDRSVIFQPSICFPAFLRDLFIVLILKLLRSDVKFVLLVDVIYKNPLMKVNLFREWFFGGSRVFGPAIPSLSIKNFHQSAPYFESDGLTANILSGECDRICFLHIGYKSWIKGWDRFQQFSCNNQQTFDFAYIGAEHSDEIGSLDAKKFRSFCGGSPAETQKVLTEQFEDHYPALLFMSRFDFAPLTVLECGYWGVPICVLAGSDSVEILSRLLPRNCYVVFDLTESKETLLAAMQASQVELAAFLRGQRLPSLGSHLSDRDII